MRSWRLHLKRFGKQLWVRAFLFSILAIVTAFAAIVFDPLIPDDVEDVVGAEAIDAILGILATSMLTVTTFSLTTMVTAFTASTQDVTPRATRLLMADTTTHNVLATFIGTFLYALVGIIVLSMEAYGPGGRVVLFAVTILVILVVVAALLRWIDHLTRLGRVNETTRIVAQTAEEAIRSYLEHPGSGGAIAGAGAAARGVPVVADRIGYVTHVDMQVLSDLAEEAGATVLVVARPGTFVHTASSLALVSGGHLDPKAVNDAFSVEVERTFEQDPLFGLAVMAEIASRALSPGINDPGTAIDVIGRSMRLIALLGDGGDKRPPVVRFPRLSMPAIPIADFLDHIFTPIARDGSDKVEVQVRIQKALAALAAIDPDLFASETRHLAIISLQRAEAAMPNDDDRRRVRSAAAELVSENSGGRLPA